MFESDDEETWEVEAAPPDDGDDDEEKPPQGRPDVDGPAASEGVVTVTFDMDHSANMNNGRSKRLSMEERHMFASMRAERVRLRNVQLLCLLSHGIVRMRLCQSDPVLKAVAALDVPVHVRKWADCELSAFPVALWWQGYFKTKASTSTTPSGDLVEALQRRTGTAAESVELFAALCIVLGMRTRTVRLLQPAALLRTHQSAISLLEDTVKVLPPVVGASASSSPPKLGRSKTAPARAGPTVSVPNEWVEVFWTKENRWIAVDPLRGTHDCAADIAALETFASAGNHVLFAIAFEAKLQQQGRVHVRDVSRRYTNRWSTYTHKQRGVDEQWWFESIAVLAVPFDDWEDEDASRWEDAELKTMEDREDMPTTFDKFKNNPKYALERHVKKYEMIYPKVPVVGHFKGEPIYKRENVRPLHTKEAWLKEGRVIKSEQQPVKHVKSIKRSPSKGTSRHNIGDEEDIPDEQEMPPGIEAPLFGEWQTERYRAAPAKDGKVPRNEFNNVDLYQPWMLPHGTVHLTQPGLWQVARRLEVDFADAVIGFEFKKGRTFPIKEGIIVCVEFQSALLAAWDEAVRHKAEQERLLRAKQACLRWRHLVKNMLVANSLREKYTPSNSSAPVAQSANDVLTPFVAVNAHQHEWISQYDDFNEQMRYICNCGARTTERPDHFQSPDDDGMETTIASSADTKRKPLLLQQESESKHKKLRLSKKPSSSEDDL